MRLLAAAALAGVGMGLLLVLRRRRRRGASAAGTHEGPRARWALEDLVALELLPDYLFVYKQHDLNIDGGRVGAGSAGPLDKPLCRYPPQSWQL